MKQNIPFCNLQLDEAFKLSIMEYIAWIGGGGEGVVPGQATSFDKRLQV